MRKALILLIILLIMASSVGKTPVSYALTVVSANEFYLGVSEYAYLGISVFGLEPENVTVIRDTDVLSVHWGYVVLQLQPVGTYWKIRIEETSKHGCIHLFYLMLQASNETWFARLNVTVHADTDIYDNLITEVTFRLYKLNFTSGKLEAVESTTYTYYLDPDVYAALIRFENGRMIYSVLGDNFRRDLVSISFNTTYFDKVAFSWLTWNFEVDYSTQQIHLWITRDTRVLFEHIEIIDVSNVVWSDTGVKVRTIDIPTVITYKMSGSEFIWNAFTNALKTIGSFIVGLYAAFNSAILQALAWVWNSVIWPSLKGVFEAVYAMLPPEIRGIIDLIVSVLWIFGQIVVFLCNIIGVIPTFLILWHMYTVAQAAWWLSLGRLDRAEACVAKIFNFWKSIIEFLATVLIPI